MFESDAEGGGPHGGLRGAVHVPQGGATRQELPREVARHGLAAAPDPQVLRIALPARRTVGRRVSRPVVDDQRTPRRVGGWVATYHSMRHEAGVACMMVMGSRAASLSSSSVFSRKPSLSLCLCVVGHACVSELSR